MTQTLQEALLKAGLVSKEKLAKAEAEKKATQRAQRQHQQDNRGNQRPRAGQAGHFGSNRGANPDTPHRDSKPVQPPQPSGPRKAPPPPRPATPRTPPPPKKGPGFIEGKHLHHIRTNCEACGRSSPDVEYYEHKNRALDKYWLCVKCADDNNILDEFRQTMQSSHAQKGFFQRGYGPTKIFRRT